jgi:hypothetical protein
MNIPALREIIEERKGKAVETLSASYAKNRLPLEEYERLVEYINKIESERDLVVVEKIVAEYSVDKDTRPANDDEDDEPDYPSHHDHRNSLSNLTILSSRNFSGPVKSGSQYVSILGSGNIKIRKEDLNKRKVVLNVLSILGDSLILVEPGIRVTNRVIPILGSAWIDNKVNKQSRSGDPELVISGTSLLGNITVKLLKDKE